MNLLILLAAISAWADSEVIKSTLEANQTCSNFVRYDQQNIYLGFGNYRRGVEEPRKPIPARLQILPLAGESAAVLSTADAAIDSIRDDDSLFVLTYSGIEEWSLAAKSRKAIYSTYVFPGTMAYLQHPQAFARYGDKAVIAHGRLGLSFFDLKSKRITTQFRLIPRQAPLESTAMGIAIAGKYAYVLMDNFSRVIDGKPPFRGIVVVDLSSEKVIAEIDGLDPGADAIATDGKKLIVSFMGMPVWKYALQDLRGNELPEPEMRVWSFPISGNPTGRPVMDEKYYYTCFQASGQAGVPPKKIPVALNRKQLMLD